MKAAFVFNECAFQKRHPAAGLGLFCRRLAASWGEHPCCLRQMGLSDSSSSSICRLTAGHTWSALMDLRVIPEGLTEPTMSGVIFQRQAQLRWSLPLGESFKFDLAADDPASTDVFENQSLEARYPVPDYIASVDYSRLGMGHVRIGGVARRLKN